MLGGAALHRFPPGKPAVADCARCGSCPASAGSCIVYQLARFYRTLGMLLRGGMPVPPSLSMVSDLLESSAARPAGTTPRR
jgi:hypothetical protein